MSLGTSVALAAERIVQPVEGMHRAIARPWFAALGSLGRPLQVVHDVISRVVYGSIRVGAAALGVGLDTRVAADSPSGVSAQAFVNGLWGDALGRHEARLGTLMSVRSRRGDHLPIGPELGDEFPAATGRLVVLVHGLIKTERCWEGTETQPGLIHLVEQHPALTPVAIRYNTGLPVATNGAQLASLVEAVHAQWPVPVSSIALVGHSMGGLVIRAACAAARRGGHRWIDDVSDVVTIGAPHRGAPLEKFVNMVALGLDLTPQTRPLAQFLDTRSQGIKDLRSGSGDVGWETEPGAGPPSSDVRYHVVAGVVTSDPAHPIGAALGDLMVRPASSVRATQLDPTNVVVFGGVHHFGLLNAPAAVDQIMGWLAPPE